MLSRRGFNLVALGAVALAALAVQTPRPAVAEPSYQRFVPLLIDLPGWEGGKPEGVAMEIGGAAMANATRRYERGEARLDAQVVTGPAAQGAMAGAASGIKMETPDGRLSSGPIDGFAVTRTYTFSDKSGAVIVGLRDNALFSLTFSGVDDEEALTLAKKFDWKAIQAEVGK